MDGVRIDKNTRNTRPSERIMKIADIELGEKPPAAGADGGRDRPVVPLHVQAVRRRRGLHGIHLVRRADTRCGQVAQKLEIDDAERPVGIQLYGHLVEPMVEAARMAEAAGPDIIDINFGCP